MWSFPRIDHHYHPPEFIPFPRVSPLLPIPFPPREVNDFLPTLTWTIPSIENTNIQPPALFRQINPSIFPLIKFPSHFLPPESRNPYKQNQLTHHVQFRKSSDIQPFSDLFQLLLNEKSMNVDKHPYLRLFQALPLNDQLNCFTRSHLMTHEQLRIRWQLAFDIQHLLRLTFPQCQVYVFGSLLTGLGDSNSDVDLYADLLGDDGLYFQQLPCPITAIRHVRDWIKVVLLRSRALHTSDPLTFDIRSIGKQVPYVRFTHFLTNLSCDLSVGNRIPVQNSKLLLFYLNYDPRVGPLMTFLRYWGKYHGVAGESDIKHYALSLLAVVYLTKKRILPSIHLLQTLEAENRRLNGVMRNPDEIENWDTSFCEDVRFINLHFVNRFTCTSQEYSANSGRILLEMALGFFEMFAKVDYFKLMICPLIGDFIEKSIFMTRNERYLPQVFKTGWSFDNVELTKPLCIQDPFVLTFNVGKFVKLQTVRKFQKACQLTFHSLWPKKEQISSLLDLFVHVPGDNDDDGMSN